eukprot:6172098-Pleurochrysis_carterae.AAC.2
MRIEVHADSRALSLCAAACVLGVPERHTHTFYAGAWTKVSKRESDASTNRSDLILHLRENEKEHVRVQMRVLVRAEKKWERR